MTFWEWLFPFGRGQENMERYTELRSGPILNTIARLEQRIMERFPESGLSKVCKEFHVLAVRSELLARNLRKPIWPVRIIAILAALLLTGLVIFAVQQLVANFSLGSEGMLQLLQSAESVVNELIFMGLAIYFLVSIEARLKRHSALKALHHLRSIAHIVDMHQLTKDPTQHVVSIVQTQSSPERKLNRAELTRYLDYCSEILSLDAKIAALFAQNVDDEVVLTAVNDLELLTQGLCGKIWQKIMILDLGE
ncbi:MAG: hypothetical protein JNJ57_19275 [Saprospiraceae bacterium]|nr:hypothetical protein [Saprospiraceae bacterium]